LHAEGWDIGSHSVTHSRLTEVDDSTLHYELRQSQTELQARGILARHFAVPFGAYDERVLDVLRLYYDSNRLAEGLNSGLLEVDPYLLKSRSAMSWFNLGVYIADMDSMVSTGGWYVLSNHVIAGFCRGCEWCMTESMLASLIDYATSCRMKFVTISEGLDFLSSLGASGPRGRACRAVGRSSPHMGSSAALRCWSVPEGSGARIYYEAPQGDCASVEIFCLRGRLVRELESNRGDYGRGAILWDGCDSSGDPVASGVYIYRVKAEGGRVIGKIALLK
jgi:hypothetical protein